MSKVKATAEAVSDSTPSSSSSNSSSADTTYTVVSGDTLSGIAERALGNGDDYPELFKLNKDRSEPNGGTFTDPNLIVTGWTLELPSGSGSATTSSSSSSDFELLGLEHDGVDLQRHLVVQLVFVRLGVLLVERLLFQLVLVDDLRGRPSTAGSTRRSRSSASTATPSRTTRSTRPR